MCIIPADGIIILPPQIQSVQIASSKNNVIAKYLNCRSFPKYCGNSKKLWSKKNQDEG
jgi:hypothetical protein